MKIKPDSDLAKFIPYSSHVHEKVVKTVEGEYLMVWSLKGIPFVGRNPEELSHKHATFNRLLQSVRAPDYTHVAFWSHDIRRQVNVTLKGEFKASFNEKVDTEYYAQINKHDVFINEMYLTLLYRPDESTRSSGATVEALREIEKNCISILLDLGKNVEATLDEYSPRCLSTYQSDEGVLFSEVLEFFHYLINHSIEKVPVLPARIFNYLGISKHSFNNKTGGFLIKNAADNPVYGSIISIKEYPEATSPGVLNNLKYLNCEYVITQSFSPITRGQALTIVERYRTRMLAVKDKAVSQVEQLNDALDGIASSNFIMGDFHFTLTVFGKTMSEVSEVMPDIRSVLSSSGIVTLREHLVVMPAFYAQFPGNFKYRSRKSLLTSLNFLGFNPFHTFATGKRENNPWGDAVTILQAVNGQPYFFNFHATRLNELSFGEKALGNTMVIGKSGTGKTALISFLLSQVQKYNPSPTIFFFDKDKGAEIFIRACGGRYMAVEAGQSTGFNPLQCENTPKNRLFIGNLVKLLTNKYDCASSEEDDINRAVNAIMDTPSRLRTMTNLRASFPNLGDNSIYAKLKKWTNEGALGWVFDNPQDTINFEDATIIGFDYTELIDMPEIRVAVMSYLIKRMEDLIDGRRFIYVMDEFWKILEGEGGLKDFAFNKLKTIRKQNGLGIFATQSPEDALKSDISAALVEQTATLILLPNPSADEKDYIQGLKLTRSEFDAIRALDERSRCFMVKQGHDAAICQLKLGALPEVIAVLSASTDNIKILHNILDRYKDKDNKNATIDKHSKKSLIESKFDHINPELWLNDFFKEFKGYRAKDVSEDQKK